MHPRQQNGTVKQIYCDLIKQWSRLEDVKGPFQDDCSFIQLTIIVLPPHLKLHAIMTSHKSLLPLFGDRCPYVSSLYDYSPAE